MNNYNFKVIARIREDLNPQEKQYINDYLNEWKEKFEVKKIDDETYCKDGIIEGYNDFGPVAFFYCIMEDEKKYFSKLEYHDLENEKESRIAV